MNCWYWRCGAGGAVGLRGNANTQAAVLVLRTPVVVRTPRGPARRPSWPDGQPVRALVLAPSKAADGRLDILPALKGRGFQLRDPEGSVLRFTVHRPGPVSYTHLRAHETRHDLVCRLLLEKKKKKTTAHTTKT